MATKTCREWCVKHNGVVDACDGPTILLPDLPEMTLLDITGNPVIVLGDAFLTPQQAMLVAASLRTLAGLAGQQ